MTGRLDDRDPYSSTGGRFDRWRIEARRGETLYLHMSSSDFDTFVQIGRATPGGEFQEIAFDDDGTGTLDSLLEFRAPESGVYEVRATSYAGDEYGSYVLSRSSTMPYLPDPYAHDDHDHGEGDVQPLPLDVGGYIDLDDPVDEDGRHYESWRIFIPTNHVVRMRQMSDDLDSWVSIGVIAQDGSWVGLFHNDDSDGTLNSDMVFQSVADDVFEVRASTYAPGASGPYRLIVEDVSATSEGGLMPGYTVDGWISDADNPGSGAFYEDRYFYAAAGQTVTVTLASSDFDAYLIIGWDNEGMLEQIVEDDDSGGGDTGFDAQATFVAPFTGLYIARLTTYSEGETGVFAFSVEAD